MSSLTRRLADKIGTFTGWRDNPASVFILALPLFLIAIFLMGMVAYLEYRFHGDSVYAWIMLGGLVLLALGLYPPYMMYKRLQRLTADPVTRQNK